MTTFANATRLHDYKIAIELNNIGVKLMEGRAYRSAMETLKGSVEVMKQVVSPNQQGWSDIGAIHTMQARRRLGQLQTNTSTSNAYIYSRGQGFQVRQEPQDISSTWDDESSPSLSNPILIDVSEVIDTEELSPDLESAILFHNLAVAELLCMNGHVCNKNIFLQGALDLFEMAFSITVSASEALMDMSLEDIRELGATRVFLAIVLLNNVIRVKEALGKKEEAHESCQHLVRLELAVMVQEGGMDYVEVSSAAPAA